MSGAWSLGTWQNLCCPLSGSLAISSQCCTRNQATFFTVPQQGIKTGSRNHGDTVAFSPTKAHRHRPSFGKFENYCIPFPHFRLCWKFGLPTSSELISIRILHQAKFPVLSPSTCARYQRFAAATCQRRGLHCGAASYAMPSGRGTLAGSPSSQVMRASDNQHEPHSHNRISMR